MQGPELIQFLKHSSSQSDSCTMGFQVGDVPVAFIRPVITDANNINQSDIKLLTDWRNKYGDSFLTEFLATTKRTESWLINTVDKDDRKILFMINLPTGQTVGHIGLGYIDWDNSYVEADAIVNGGNAPPGVMKKSLLSLIQWSKIHLSLKNVCVRVRSDNMAIGFYHNIGFTEYNRVPLVPIINNSEVVWKEDPNSNSFVNSLIYMKYKW